MSQTLTLPVGFRALPGDAGARVSSKVALALIFAALTAIGALIRFPLPFTPVPITLQTMFVMASGLFLGPLYGLLSMLFYLTLGAIGLPAFNGGSSGVAMLTGATGGYLFGFLLYSYFSGKLYATGAFQRRSFPLQLVALYLLGLATIFLPGVSHLKLTLGLSWGEALAMGYYPFIAGDILKTLVAFGGIKALERRFSEASPPR